MFDLLFKNAKVVDGSGAPWYMADVAVKDGVIAEIGKIPESSAAMVIDAEKNVLSPGFIDIHTHSDSMIFKHKTAESRILQGVTTDLAGDCGSSTFPYTLKQKETSTRFKELPELGLTFDWTDANGYLNKVEKNGTSVNFAMLAGHGTIRAAVMGYEDRKATTDELKEMQKLTAQCMEQGCYGLSTGFIYSPGCFANNEEVIELCKIVADYGGFYKSHMRHEGKKVMKSVEDTIEVGIKAGLPVQIDHHKITGRRNWKYKCFATMAYVERARAEGIDVTLDQYPYRASATSLTSILPEWVFEGGTPKMIERLKDTAVRSKIIAVKRKEYDKILKLWSDVYITSLPSEKNAWMKGLNMQEIADKRSIDPYEAAIDLIIEEEGNVSQLTFGMCEEDIEVIMKSPYTMIGSDGSAMSIDTKDVPHPRSYGTFPRVIGEYSRNRKLFSLETAVNKMTGMPAARLKLGDRGLIKKGMCADLVLFNPNTIIDTPTFNKPNVACEGILQVYVNGVLTAENGKHTGALAGKVLRRGK